jgi:hypothetical protein
LLNRISLCALLIAVLAATSDGPLRAAEPSVVDLDARSRAEGNRMALAVQIGDRLFATPWPAQVLKVEANGIGTHVVVGLMLSGVKFHEPLTKQGFMQEVATLAARAFAVSAQIDEVDVWASVPIKVGKGAIVSGDLAMPTSRNVFAVTLMRGETPEAIAARLEDGRDAFWDQDWERTAFKKGP